MTILALNTAIPYPPVHGCRGNTGSPIDAAGEKFAFIFPVPYTGDVSAILFRVGTLTTAESLQISLQSIDASGNPDGTILGATNNGYGTVATPATNTEYEVSLGESVSVTRGVPICVVVEFTSTTGDLQISHNNYGPPVNHNNAYSAVYTASWAKTADPGVRCALSYSGTYYPTTWNSPITSGTNATATSGSTDPERGTRLQMLVPATCIGVWHYGDLDGDATIRLYDGASHIALATINADNVNRVTSSVAVYQRYFSSNISLSKDTWYRVTIEPDTATSISLARFDVSAVGRWDSMPLQQNCYSTLWDVSGSAWVDTTTRRYSIGLLLSGFDDGAGGGGVAPGILTPVMGAYPYY